MDNFKITLNNIQHINKFEYEFDLSLNKLHCIVGKNSVGKTTLIKAIQNLKETNTLDKLSRINIIKENSSIIYNINDIQIKLKPLNNDERYILDTRDTIDTNIINNIHTELPMPNDIRTKVYQKFNEDYKNKKSGSDTYKIQAESFSSDLKEATDLLYILNFIYDTSKFNNLKQISIGKKIYYIQKFDNYYLREDDFSSGEYMIVQIYKLIQNKTKMIVIDEIDISLDSSAQVKFIEILKELCEEYEINIIFTTHSLAIMKKIDEIGEDLLYMENDNGDVSIESRSYNFIKAELFQFTGYDKIILVEDILAEKFIRYNLNINTNVKYNIIPIGGHTDVIRIMENNKNSNFLGTKKVLSILDGDQQNNGKEPKYDNIDDIIFLPILSIEKELHKYFINDKLEFTRNNTNYPSTMKHKILYKRIIDKNDMTNEQIFDLIYIQKQTAVDIFINKIIVFLDL